MKFARKTDFIIIAAVALLALISLTVYLKVINKKGVYAEIYYQSKLVKTVDLSAGQDKLFSIEQEPDITFHLYKDGSIAFVHSDCPDKVCIESGKLNMAGQYAACLPNQVYVRIVSNNPAAVAPDLRIG